MIYAGMVLAGVFYMVIWSFWCEKPDNRLFYWLIEHEVILF